MSEHAPESLPVSTRSRPERLENLALWTAGFFPVGLVLGNAVFEGLMALTVIFWLASLMTGRRNPAPGLAAHPLVIPWLSWYAAILVSLVMNGPGSKGAGHDIAFGRAVLFAFAIMDIGSRRPELPRFLIRGMAAAVVLAAANTALAYASGFDLVLRPLDSYTRKLGITPQIGGVAVYSVVFFGSWAAADSALPARSRRLYALVAILAMLQLFQIHSRTPILAALAGLIFALWFHWTRGRRSALGIILAGIFLSGVLATLICLHLWSTASIYDRFYIWRVSFTLFKDHPLFGVGVSSFKDAFTALSSHGLVEGVVSPAGRLFQKPVETHAHNLVLMLLASTGLFGLLAFGWLFVRVSRLIFSSPKGHRLGLPGWPAALFVMGLSGENIYYSWYHAWVSFIFAFAGIALASREDP